VRHLVIDRQLISKSTSHSVARCALRTGGPLVARCEVCVCACVRVCVCLCVYRQKDTQKLRWHDVELKIDLPVNECAIQNNKPHSLCEVARRIPEQSATWSVFSGILGKVRRDLPN